MLDSFTLPLNDEVHFLALCKLLDDLVAWQMNDILQLFDNEVHCYLRAGFEDDVVAYHFVQQELLHFVSEEGREQV